MRAKSVRLTPNLSDTNRQKAWDRELDRYESAVNQGLQPEGTTTAAVDRAFREAEHG